MRFEVLRTASFDLPHSSWITPSACSTLPLICSVVSPVMPPAASRRRPSTCLALPLIRSLSILLSLSVPGSTLRDRQVCHTPGFYCEPLSFDEPPLVPLPVPLPDPVLLPELSVFVLFELPLSVFVLSGAGLGLGG